MKITIDLKSVEQSWNADTGEESHFLVFELGGRLHRLRCTESELIAAVGKAKTAARAPHAEMTPSAPDDGVDALEDALRGEGYDHSDNSYPTDDDFAQDQVAFNGGGQGSVGDEPEAVSAGVLQGLAGRLEGEAEAPDIFAQPKPVDPRAATDEERLEARRAQVAANTPSRPRTTHGIKQERKDRLREIAKTAPRRTVPHDSNGYPVVPQTHAPPTTQPSSPEGFEIRRPTSTTRSDDDPFQQG